MSDVLLTPEERRALRETRCEKQDGALRKWIEVGLLRPAGKPRDGQRAYELTPETELSQKAKDYFNHLAKNKAN